MPRLQTILRALSGDTRGVSAMEFALLAPVFSGVIFGIIEFSRIQFAQQTIESVAHEAARCAAIGQDNCSTVLEIQKFS